MSTIREQRLLIGNITVFMKVIEQKKLRNKRFYKSCMHCGKARRANPRYGQRPAPKEKDTIKYRNLFDRKTELNIRGVNLTQARLLYLRLFIAACELFGVRRVLSRVIAAKEGKPPPKL